MHWMALVQAMRPKMVWMFLSATTMLLLLLPDQGHAVPMWARKYDVQCSVCHTRPPRLNKFGEAFHMMGFQIPGAPDTDTTGGRKTVGGIWLDPVSNILSFRANGNLVERFDFSEGRSDETTFAFPEEVTLFLGGTIMPSVSYFFEIEGEPREVEFSGGEFEREAEFGIGKEAFVMLDLPSLLRGGDHGMMMMDGGLFGMTHGPMLMAGKIDPNTNFSYPTNRQLFLNIPAQPKDGVIKRHALTPYAFASKFVGLFDGDRDPILPTREILFNTTGDFGLDFHGRLWGNRFLYDFGVLGSTQGTVQNASETKIPYLMLRFDFGESQLFTGSVSAFANYGFQAARVPDPHDLDEGGSFVNWLRYGLGFNVVYRWLDLYGAVVWDQLQQVPGELNDIFDRTAFGFTLESDFLVTDRWLLSLRYDHLDAGGLFVASEPLGGGRRSSRVLGLQARYYLRQNFAMFIRDSINLASSEDHPFRNWRNGVFLGLDFAF